MSPDYLITNEKIILLKVAEGDEKSFRQLFKLYYNLLGDFIMRITESKPLTEEIVQDVFLKIWIKRGSLTEIDCFKAYLFVVAKNHAFNCLKQLAKEKIQKKEWLNTVLHASASNEETESVDACELIDQAVELLPPQQKKVYTLSRRAGMKQVEIARELNVSLETVKKHMVLALSFLKKYLRTHTVLFILHMVYLFKG